MTRNFRNIPPRSGAMVEALRGLGYSTSTAIADIIDNSIAANARKIEIIFNWAGATSSVFILDDGVGMTDGELEIAMSLGQKNPLDERDVSDLGRFGMGLKTASFSQCRSLTVASQKNGVLSCLRWDLDTLSTNKNGEWTLLEGPAEGSEHLLDKLPKEISGTIVIWENLDRLITPSFFEQDFLDMIDRVEAHLGMVFHRFIEGATPKLSININGRPIKAWDPFLSKNPATWSSPPISIPSESGIIKVQGFVLPHKDRLDPAVYENAGGPDGWTAQQGFYVYRNERLLVAGSWLGLGRSRSWTKEEAHRLARIRLDVPNSADAEWKINVIKSTARPPVSIRNRLIRIAEDTRERARRVFAHRGQSVKSLGSVAIEEVWRAEHFKGGIRYKIDLTHPAVKNVLDEIIGTNSEADFRAMLRVVEETIPVQRIWLDTAEAKETPRTGFANEGSAEIAEIAKVMYENLVLKKGVSCALARAQLLRTEPFNNFPDLVNTLPEISIKSE